MNQLSIRKNNLETKKKKKGFTLIELIIVIAIIAIIAAIAIPKFGKVKDDANLAADKANAKIIATATAQAVAEGKITTDGQVSSSIYKVYIDGGAVPVAKHGTAKSFKVVYNVKDADAVPASGSTPAVDAKVGGITITSVTGDDGSGTEVDKLYPSN